MALTTFLDVHWQKQDEGSAAILAPLDILDIMVSWLGGGQHCFMLIVFIPLGWF